MGDLEHLKTAFGKKFLENGPSQIDFTSIKKVLVAKLRHHGDVLLSAPLFSALKGRYPHLEIDAYIYGETLPMLEGHPAISDFLLYDKGWKKLPVWKRFFKEAAILRRIRKGKYDLVINLTEGDRGAIAAKVSKAPYAIGWDPQGGGMKGKAKCYTHLIKHPPRPRHTVEKQLDALRCLGIFPTEKERELFFHIPDEARERVRALLPEKVVCMHAVSRWMFKTLPVKTMRKVVSHFQKEGVAVVLTASPDPIEREMTASIGEGFDNVIDLSGKISLKELGAVIEHSALLITVDSVSLHLASALKTAVVALFGPTCEENWGPYRNPQSVVVTTPISCRPCYQPGCGGSGKSDCLMTLSAEKIIEAILKVQNLPQNSSPAPLCLLKDLESSPHG